MKCRQPELDYELYVYEISGPFRHTQKHQRIDIYLQRNGWNLFVKKFIAYDTVYFANVISYLQTVDIPPK